MSEDAQLDAIEADVGHPGDKWESLLEHVQAANVRQFTDIQDRWLDLMWCLDRYRSADRCPRGMGNSKVASEARRLGGVYRGKGGWFAQLLTVLLENRTDARLGGRTRVQGFSQVHQIDIAWPDRDRDVLVCIESKVTGAPASASDPARGALADFSNRRKELKFAATDLKLYRRQQETKIDHWGVWRANAAPKAYFVWAARLHDGDTIEQMTHEAQMLVNTYLDGAGVVAWRVRPDGGAYEAVSAPPHAMVSSLDDVLHRIAAEIEQIASSSGGEAPEPVTPARRALAPEELPSQ